MTWGMEDQVTERFTSAGVDGEKISFERGTWKFDYPGPPSDFVALFRDYYGPTMGAFDAAEANGRAAELQKELEVLFDEQNTSRNNHTSIPATFLRVSVAT